MKRFYAVQHGDNFDWDYGSTVWHEAVKMANAMKRDPEYNGEEIRIAVIDCAFNYCLEEIIIRDGARQTEIKRGGMNIAECTRKISLNLSCFAPSITMDITIPNDRDAEEYIDELLDRILAEEFRYNAEWDFV